MGRSWSSRLLMADYLIIRWNPPSCPAAALSWRQMIPDGIRLLMFWEPIREKQTWAKQQTPGNDLFWGVYTCLDTKLLRFALLKLYCFNHFCLNWLESVWNYLPFPNINLLLRNISSKYLVYLLLTKSLWLPTKLPDKAKFEGQENTKTATQIC